MKNEELYLETDVSGVRLGAGHFQVRDGMWFPKDKALDKSVFLAIAFTSKSLTSAKTHYSNIER